MQTLPWCKKPVIYFDPYRKTSEDGVHRSEVYSTRVGPKDPALSRFSVIKKRKKKNGIYAKMSIRNELN